MVGLKFLKIGGTFLLSLSVSLGTSEFIGSVADIATKMKKGIKKKDYDKNKPGEVFGVLDPKSLT